MSSARIDRTEADLGSKKRGSAPASDSRNKGPKGPVPNPSPDRHATTPLSAAGAARAVHRQPTGSGLGPPVPSPQSQSFSRGYGSILPTSLAYIVPSTRGCSPWRPDAVMSTTGREEAPRSSGFSRPPGSAPDIGPRDVRCSSAAGPLPPAEPFPGWAGLPFTWNLSPLRPSKFSFEYLLLPPPRSAPTTASARAHALGFTADQPRALLLIGLGPCPDGRVSAQLGTVTQLPVHPASPVLLTKNGPLGALDSVARLNRAAVPSYLFKGSSYPEGNFGGNQLLDGSISLSPLYPSQTNDLHVSIAAGLHQSFLWLRPAQA
ncbi:hypothetical protein VNO80_34426 [Phaseolus coccineus]|uniref:Uncharacterized protein n=1 Tax=Phaseolus coccineus TaxID=3886 RepID=A0AAN9Q7Y1_PHACN